MTIAALLRNRSVVSKKLRSPSSGTREDFVRRRARRLIELHPGMEDPARKGDLSAAATAIAATQLPKELPRVRAARNEIAKRIRTDPDHLGLSMATIRSGSPPDRR